MNTQDIENTIDQLGIDLAAAATLEVKIKAAKKILVDNIEAGSATEGKFFRASHSFSERKSTAWKTIAERLKASNQMIVANTKKTPVDTIKIVSRIG